MNTDHMSVMLLAGFHLGISSWGGSSVTDHVAIRPRRGEGRLHIIGNILGDKLGQFGGEVELFGGEASPAPPSLDETLTCKDCFCQLPSPD